MTTAHSNSRWTDCPAALQKGDENLGWYSSSMKRGGKLSVITFHLKSARTKWLCNHPMSRHSRIIFAAHVVVLSLHTCNMNFE